MSWSVSAIGRTQAVKVALEKQFTSAKEATKSILHENRSVAIAESLVNNELDALKDAERVQVVSVQANGSASTQNGHVLSSQINVEVKPLYGFVE